MISLMITIRTLNFSNNEIVSSNFPVYIFTGLTFHCYRNSFNNGFRVVRFLILLFILTCAIAMEIVVTTDSTTLIPELSNSLSTDVPHVNKTSDSNSTKIHNLDSHHEPNSNTPDKLPVNWHYFTWPLLGSTILVSSIAWIVVKRKAGPRVLYMSRIPRIVVPTRI